MKRLALLLVLVAVPAMAKRPNVIVVNIDNHDKWSLGCFGNRFIETPNIDRLFREGVRFDNFRTAGRCTSSRSALLTGRYHARNGALGTGSAWGQTREGVTTIAHVFREAGYQTAMFGKWHMGDTYPLRPEDRGFDEVVTIHNGTTLAHVLVEKGYDGSSRTGAAYRFRHNGQWEVYKGWRTDTWFSELDRFLSQQRDKEEPFFVYLATVTAHGPHRGPEDLRDRYKAKYESPEWAALRTRFESELKGRKKPKPGKSPTYPYDHAADIAGLDRNVGRMLATLGRLGLTDNTVVVYMSDGSGSGPASLPRDKQTADFGPSANPMCLRWPALELEPGTAKRELVSNIDIMATLAELCGIPLGKDLETSTDGRSFAALLGVPNVAPWAPRAYVCDHQSTGIKSKAATDMMMMSPLSSTTVHLPNGDNVTWRGGKPASKTTPDTVAAAKTAYDQWLQRVLADFPLGAFARAGPDTPAAYLDAYPIPGGPATPDRATYFLLETERAGVYEIDTNTADRYGGSGKTGGTPGGALKLYRQVLPNPLPVGFDEDLGGYRVLPETLATAFKEVPCIGTFPGRVQLEKGRYLLHVKSASKRPPRTLRVCSETDG